MRRPRGTGCAMAVVAGLASACAPQVDPSRGDAGFQGCVWSAPPRAPIDAAGAGLDAGVCTVDGRRSCESWVFATNSGSDLVVYASCSAYEGCVAADVCNGPACTCGGRPACADGSVCGRLPGETVPSCVVCLP